MIGFPLRLRPTGEIALPAAAWFVPGDDPRGWLEALARLGIPAAGAVVLVVPRSLRDRRPCGAQIVGASDVATGAPPPRALPYARAGRSLYIPADAMLDPLPTSKELDGLPWHAAIVHPSVGLVGYDAEDALRPADLLSAPPARTAAWNGARPGIARPRPIIAIEPIERPTAAAVLASSRGDIGTEDASRLPRAPGESFRARIADALRRAARALVRWLRAGPGPAGGRSPARRTASALPPDLDAARARELRRLAHLLDADPDSGLRFALPLGGIGAPRGLAPPGSGLVERDVGFRLDRLGGGEPVDVWRVSGEVRHMLSKKYRDLATRETALGRHRRAAYIYAELLADLESAVAALRDGGHFREAAAILRDRLNRPIAAAECLEKGGILAEAIEIYVAGARFEKAGELERRLGREDEARRHFRSAVDQLRERRELVGAARILDRQLAASDEALALLASGWPASSQAESCLREELRLLASKGREAEALRRIAQLRDETVVPAITPLARVLAETARDPASAHLGAADAARVVAGRGLRESPATHEMESLVAVVTALAPADRLLGRDGRRFLEERRSRPAPSAPARPGGGPVTAVGANILPPEVVWQRAVATPDMLIALGSRHGHPVIGGARWRSFANTTGWPDRVREGAAPILVAGAGDQAAIVAFVGERPLRAVGLALPPPIASPGAVGASISVGTPTWLPGDAVGVGRSGSRLLVLRRTEDDRLALCEHGGGGRLHETREIAAGVGRPALPDEAGIIVESRGAVFVAFGRVLRIVLAGSTVDPLPDGVASIAASAGWSRPRVVASFEQGAELLDGLRNWSPGPRFAEDLDEPLAAFTGGGAVVLVSGRAGRLYGLHESGRGVLRAEFDIGLAAPPIAVLPAPHAFEFAVMAADGEVRIFRVAGAT